MGIPENHPAILQAVARGLIPPAGVVPAPAPAPAPETEKAFQARVVKLARELGWLVYHTHDSRRSAVGFPDLVLIHERRGQLVAAELKVPPNRPSAAQLTWLDAFAAVRETTAGLWVPDQWGEIERVLHEGGA